MDAKKVIKYVVLVMVLGNLALMAYVFLSGSSPKPAPMPNPNGYEDFLKAGPMVKGNLANYQNMTREELANLVATNVDALKWLETGLSKECRVSNDYSPSFISSGLMPRASAWKDCAVLFKADGRLAEMEGRTNDAAKIYLDGMRFGVKCSRGGVLIEKLVGVACQSASASPLKNLMTSLDSKQCASIAHGLEAMDSYEDSDEDVIRQEREFGNATGGIKYQFARLLMFKSIHESEQNTLAKVHAWTKQRRQMMVAFAARAYELDKGKPPATTADLVPEYLKKIPQDPVTGTNLVSHP